MFLSVNDNYVPVDFTIMDIECELSCPIILGRPFLRTVGAIIDMKEGLNNFSCFSLCDVGASTSVMPKRMYDMLLILVILVFVLLILP